MPMLPRRQYEIIRSTKDNPWKRIEYIMATDELEADAIAYRRYGAMGYRTVQLAPTIRNLSAR